MQISDVFLLKENVIKEHKHSNKFPKTSRTAIMIIMTELIEEKRHHGRHRSSVKKCHKERWSVDLFALIHCTQDKTLSSVLC